MCQHGHGGYFLGKENNAEQKTSCNSLFSASQLPEQILEQRYTGKHTSAYSKHSQLFLPVARGRARYYVQGLNLTWPNWRF